MASTLEKVVAQKKDTIEAVLDGIQKGAEFMATTVGQLVPLCEVAAPVLKLALENVGSKEVLYVKDKFLEVKDKLDVISNQLEDIMLQIKKSHMDCQMFCAEENINNQFRKYVDILKAKPEFCEVKKKLFLDHYKQSDGEKNLYMLFDGVMGKSTFAEPILDVMQEYNGGNRRVLEDFCVHMKQLFVLGLIALLGYSFLTEGDQLEEDKKSEWTEKIQEVDTKMKEVIDKCINSFAEQALKDVQRMVQERTEKEVNIQGTADDLLHFLAKKYDWVKWSVRVFDPSEKTIQKLLAGDNYQEIKGMYFLVEQNNDTYVVVSYCKNPKHIPADSILELMQGSLKQKKAKAVVEDLDQRLSGVMIHAISHRRKIVVAQNFPDNCHYWEGHNKVTLCVHSDDCTEAETD